MGGGEYIGYNLIWRLIRKLKTKMESHQNCPLLCSGVAYKNNTEHYDALTSALDQIVNIEKAGDMVMDTTIIGILKPLNELEQRYKLEQTTLD